MDGNEEAKEDVPKEVRGGSVNGKMSSVSSSTESTGDEMWDVESSGDPYKITIHFIVDPGENTRTRRTLQPLLDWFDADLQLFCIAERGRKKRRGSSALQNGVNGHNNHDTPSYPSLAIMLFYHEELARDKISQVHECFKKPPWRFHHKAMPSGNVVPYPPNNQDFFTFAEDMPLWAARQVHYGTEHVRFVLFCSRGNWEDMISFYKMILRKDMDVRKTDFCCFVVYSQPGLDVQFALKMLPDNTKPKHVESAIMQFRVKEIGQLVPLLPNVCSPISDVRWQTTDYEGNKILLEVPRRKVHGVPSPYYGSPYTSASSNGTPSQSPCASPAASLQGIPLSPFTSPLSSSHTTPNSTPRSSSGSIKVPRISVLKTTTQVQRPPPQKPIPAPRPSIVPRTLKLSSHGSDVISDVTDMTSDRTDYESSVQSEADVESSRDSEVHEEDSHSVMSFFV
ncbi:protein FAM124A-like isoform X1 [Branchiostoma floridae x Branchiostoma belcheri]